MPILFIRERRLTHAVRDAKGRFKDIQTYKRAQGADINGESKSER